LRRKGADIIHGGYWFSDGPARQKREEEEVGMWQWYKRKRGYKAVSAASAGSL
jgi:hypothetical protein